MEQLFIGRKQELEELESSIFVREPGKEHPMSSASLVGPMGIGKRTLLRKAKERFERSHHPGVYLFQKKLVPKEAFAVLLKDLVQIFAGKLTEEVLRDIQDPDNGLLQKITDIYAWCSKNERVIIENPNNSNILLQVKNKFGELLSAYAGLDQHIILIISDFDNAMDMHQEKEGDATIFPYLFGLSPKGSNQNLKLNVLLVCERRPQFIASSNGSQFEVAFPPIVLHNFNEEEMDEYFQSFADLPCGKLERVIRNLILKYFGRFPQLLMDFRNHISRQGCQDIKEEDIRHFAEKQEKNGFRNALYHHLCSLMKSQWVDFGKQVSVLDTFCQYFIGQKQDLLHNPNIGELYGFGLVDKLENGKYVPLTQIDMESSELSMLAYVMAQFPVKALQGTDSDGNTASTSRNGVCGNELASAEVSWLHLSDLHVFQEADTDFMLEEYKNLAKCIHPQFLIVTGDFRDKKLGTDFSNAKKFLEEILEIFHIEKRNVILVPGNHDVDDSTSEREEAIKSITENGTNYNTYSAYLKVLYRSFYEYDSFVREFYEDSDVGGKRLTHPSESFNFTWNDRLNVLYANTALISDGIKDHKQIVDINALVKCEIDFRYPTIMIGHHDIRMLYPEFCTRVSDLFRKHNISAYLHGDIHQFDADSVSPIDKTTLPAPSIACGKSVPQSGDNTSEIGAIFYEWREDGKVYVKFYQWKNRTIREKTEYQPSIGEDYSFPMRC